MRLPVTGLPSIEFVSGIATVPDASPELLRELLKLLDAELAAGGLHLPSAFGPGMDEGAVEDALHAEGLAAPEEVVVWFGWHNGSAIRGQPLPNLYPGSLEQALKIYHAIVDEEPSEGDDPDAWYAYAGPGWLRLGAETLDLAIDCRTAAGPPLLRQPSYDFDEASGKRQARSLCTWVTWRILALRNGAYGRFSAAKQAWEFQPALVDPTQTRADFR